MPSCKEFKSSTIYSLIEMFNVCPFGDGTISVTSASDIMKDGIKRGYLIHPLCDAKYISHFLATRDMQYNSTFYKTWNDVKNKSRFELFVDQILHYMSTYGTDFSVEAYLPNVNPDEPAFNTYTVISPITYKALYVKCLGMLQSGIALKTETVAVLTDYIITFAKWQDRPVDVDSIKNREALVIICDALGVMPKDGAKLFAHIIYKVTDQTMIIKNREMRQRIQTRMRHSNRDVTESYRSIWKSLNNLQMIALAEVYNRYKSLFIAFKNPNDPVMNAIINKIGHLSKKFHKPMQRGFWETLLHKRGTYDVAEITAKAKEATNFKLLQVLQSIRERLLLAAGEGDNMYIIRNGSVYVKDNMYSAIDSEYFRWEDIYDICMKQLLDNLSKKACTVKFPEGFELACPTSEKNFIGDVPMGSVCELGKNSVMGIYWKNAWGTRDFDLSFIGMDGTRIGWSSSYYTDDQKVVYSGDITNAPNGANEVLFFADETVPSGIVHINRYNGEENSKYRLFFGTDNQENIYKNIADYTMSTYMVDPNKLKLEAEVTQGIMTQQMIGVIIEGRFYFYTLSCGYDKVATSLRYKDQKTYGRSNYTAESKNKQTEDMLRILTRKAHSFLGVKSILLKAGFVEAKKDETPDLDLSILDRSKLIELFS